MKLVLDKFLEEKGVGPDETLYAVIWQYPGRDGIGRDWDFVEVIIVSRDKAESAIKFVDTYKEVEERNSDDGEADPESLTFEEINRKELADRMATSIFDPHYTFNQCSLDSLIVE